MKFIKSFENGLRIEPRGSTAISQEGELEVTSNSLRVYVQAAARTLTTLDQTQTLTNKTMSGASNTFSNIGYSSLVLTNSIVNADINSAAAIAYSKLNLTGSIVNADINASAGIVYSKLNLTGGIVNADVNASAAIAYSKLNLASSIVNADVSASAAIAYSKLNLAGSIVNADVSASAAIAYSKLNLTGSVVNADISASAAIAYSKLNLAGSIVNADVSASAAIAFSKLAALTDGNILVGNGSNVAASVAMSGEATIINTGAVTLSNAAVIGKVLTGFTSGAGTVTASDTLLTAIQKLDGNIAAGGGDVDGPASATDNAVARFNGTTGKIIQNSGVIVDDSDNVSGVVGLTAQTGSFTPATGVSQAILSSVTNTTGSPATMAGIVSSLIADFNGAATTAYSYQSALDLQNSGSFSGSGATTPSGLRVLARRLATNSSGNIAGITSVVSNSSTGGALDAYGVNVVLANSQTATSFYGFRNQNTTTSGALTNYYGAYLSNYAGTATNNYALYVASGDSFFSGVLKSTQNDNAVTGTGASMAAPVDHVERLTDGSLVSINNIVASAGTWFVMSNVTGNSVTIVNNSGGTEADRIITGTGSDLTLENNASLWLYYDNTTARWRVVGGSGSGGSGANTALSNLAAVAINTSLISDADNTDDLGSSANRWKDLWLSGALKGDADSSLTVQDTGNLTAGGVALFDWVAATSFGLNDVDGDVSVGVYTQTLETNGTTKLDWSGTDVSLNTRKLTSVSDPTAAQDAATKNYVDKPAVTSKTTTYTAVAGTDKVILCSASSGSWTLSLPTAVGNTGITFTIKKTDSSANTITIDADGSETIDDVTTRILSVQYEAVTIVSDGAEWWVI